MQDTGVAERVVAAEFSAPELVADNELGTIPSAERRRGEGRADRVSLRLGLAVKRAIDVVVASILLVLLFPLLVVIGLIIWWDSGWPVYFKQIRIGQNRRRASPSPKRQRGEQHDRKLVRDTKLVRESFLAPTGAERRSRSGLGREFGIYKFRTMATDSPLYAKTPADTDDPRITRVGRFLRCRCLDELPQLLNVVRGEMSLIGPRPEMPFIVSKYQPVHQRRLLVKPGITGLWQLRGPRDRPIHESIEWDLQYVEEWSLRMDLAIIWETVCFMFKARNC
ncbi:MAG: sugar transferase [Phycisphaerae bacterium]